MGFLPYSEEVPVRSARMSLGLNRGEVASSLVVSEVSQMMIAWGGGGVT